MNKTIIFFLGTEAELIKIFPIIIEVKNRGLQYKIIASGQNDITKSLILKKIDCGSVDLELSKESEIKKSAIGLMKWWIHTYIGATKKIREAFHDVEFENCQMVVHGDTVSTFMGARLGKKLGMKVCHVEAGLRSHNLLSPFPEEIDRLLTSRNADVHFAPGKEATANLGKIQGVVVDTQQNTLMDSLKYSAKIPLDEKLNKVMEKEYFVFVMHRQENLANKKFVADVMREILNAAENYKCVIILHEITKNTLQSLGMMQQLENNENVEMLPRVNYFDFMKLLENAVFVITDGGSNQEELYYMNKPCLIMRTTTERKEGLGKNARLFNGHASDIRKFIKDIDKMKHADIFDSEPSKIVVNTLERL